ncbi:MAG TPA: DUF2442 domain-containing protein [Bacteroidia bacterium]|nr:DUF2442 domain-containing protein [Bacteroidia bacterium]
MKITIVKKVDKNAKEMYVSDAVYSGNHKIKIFFSDGTQTLIDFNPFLSKKHLHPTLKKYKKESAFKKFEIKHGNLMWNDYEMIFPVEELYQGKISI